MTKQQLSDRLLELMAQQYGDNYGMKYAAAYGVLQALISEEQLAYAVALNEKQAVDAQE